MSQDSGSDRTLLDELARIEHKQWWEWSNSIAKSEDLSDERLDRWRGFWVPYDELPEDVKEHDRKWAREVLELLHRYDVLDLGGLDLDRSLHTDRDREEPDEGGLRTDGGIAESGRLHGREPDHRIERSGDDLLIFTAETEDYNIAEVCADNETRHPIAFQTWDDAYDAMHAYAELFGLELVRNDRSRSTGRYRGVDHGDSR